MKFTIYQATRQGGRAGNEDRVGFSYGRDALLMVVADGMGGHLHGEVAAQIAVTSLTAEFRRLALPRVDDPAAFLPLAFQRAHAAINRFAERHGLFETPHTTCVAALVQDDTVWWAHAGDSRLYLVGEGQLVARTEDHSAVARLVRNGIITEAEARVHPERNRVSNCLGGYSAPEVETHPPIPLHGGDIVLLCTDGLWGPLDTGEICEVLRDYPLQEAVGVLMDRAEYRGGDHADNLSLVAMSWGEPRAPGQATISTLALAGDVVTTRIAAPGEAGVDVDDDELERAITEIQQAIRKVNGQ